MKKGIIAFGIVLLVVGILLSIILYPLFGYDSTSDVVYDVENRDIWGTVIGGTFGKEVKMTGEVAHVYTKEIAEITNIDGFQVVEWILKSLGIAIITLNGFDVPQYSDTDETVEVFIVTDNTELSKGNSVIVEGWLFNYGALYFIMGDNLMDMAFGALKYKTPEPAQVEQTPLPGFYLGFIVLIVGIILIAVGGKLKAKTKQITYQQPYAPVSTQTPQIPPPPPPPPTTPSYPCNTCQKPLRHVIQYNRWYCDNCRRYV